MSSFLDGAYSSCAQCPRTCGADRSGGRTGFCRETQEIKIALACLHFGEEPLVTVHGGSGTIFFTGCTLRCAFCQNYQISQQGMGRAVTQNEFTEICLRLQNAGAENINLVTGSHVIPLLAQFIDAAQKAGCTLPFCWNSSAYERTETLELLKPFVKIWLPDLKTLNSALAKQLFAAENYPAAAADAIQWMIRNFPLETRRVPAPYAYRDGENRLIPVGTVKEKITQGVIVRHLFLPGRFEETADALVWLKENADSKACISLMSQYTPVPFAEDEKRLQKRKNALQAIENRLVNRTEDGDLRDLIEAFDFDLLFYQELSDDTSWLPDFSRPQPFSNKLATPIWHWKFGFAESPIVNTSV
ncbi:MAG: radical SAM protein [Treponema sp.]